MPHPPRSPGRAAGPTTFGIVGAGEITRMVAPALAGQGGMRVAAIASRNTASARELAAILGGAEVHDDIQGLLQRPDVDAVYIATPPHLHRAMMIEAIAAGKHVICEKPFVMNLGELEDVLAALRVRPELRIASCSSRFHACPPVREARDFIGLGRLGKILRVRLANAMPPPIPLASLPAWKRSRSTGGGGIAMDWGVYDLDWLQFLLGDLFEPAEILGQTDCWGHEAARLETSFSAEIRCRSGLTIGWERRSEHGPLFQRAELRGSEGGLDLPFMPGVGAPAGLTRHWHGEDGSLHSEIISGPVGDWGQILAFPILDMADAIAQGRAAASPPSVSRKIHSVLEALYESAASGRSASVAR